MSQISEKIIEVVKGHLNEYVDNDVEIPLEGDLEAEIDRILLDVMFPVKEVVE